MATRRWFNAFAREEFLYRVTTESDVPEKIKFSQVGVTALRKLVLRPDTRYVLFGHPNSDYERIASLTPTQILANWRLHFSRWFVMAGKQVFHLKLIRGMKSPWLSPGR